MIDPNLLGWIDDPVAVMATADAMRADGHEPKFAAGQPSLNGWWAETVKRGIFHVSLWQAEKAVRGSYRAPDYQRKGTCVSRGMHRAVQDSLLNSIATKGNIGRPVEIDFATIYGGARINIGNGICGYGDGAIVAHAAEWLRRYGAVEAKRYDVADLTQPNETGSQSHQETLAVQWGTPRVGVPRELCDIAKTHPVIVHQTRTPNERADALAAGFAIAAGSNRIQGQNRDSHGMCSYSGPGGHCVEWCGVFVMPDWDGRIESLYQHTGFVPQQSWGQYPTGHPLLTVYGGESVELRDGAFGITNGEARAMIQTSDDGWAVKLKDEFRGSAA